MEFLFDEGRAKTNGKPVDGNARKLGCDEVAQFVNEHNEAEHQDRDEDGQNITCTL